ncbi:MBL fold metallo-hydrolase [Paraburkholderia tropica]|nr:MBL fold metallo-hydrolase [Paraburkholderia tropica]
MTAILLAHHHADHVGGVEQLLLSCGDATTEVSAPTRYVLSP